MKYTFVLTCILFLWNSWESPAAVPPSAVKGVLDLHQWHWESDGTVPLHGEWEFYWNQLYSSADLKEKKVIPQHHRVPGVWNSHVPGNWFDKGKGYGTYRLKIVLPRNTKPLALKYMTAATAMEVYVNGRKISSQGSVGTSAQTMRPAYAPDYVPLPVQGDTTEIIVHISNYHYFEGGLWDTLSIGQENSIRQQWLGAINLDFFVLGCFVLMGFYHLCIYLFLRNNQAVLVFSLVCLLVAARILVTGEVIINLLTHWNWSVLVHMEFLSFYLLVPVFTLFSYYLFPEELSPRILRLTFWVSAAFIGIVVVCPPFVFTHTLRFFQALVLVLIGYGLLTYIRAWINQKEGSSYFLLGFLVLAACVVNDILHNAFVIQTKQLFYVGLFVFVFSQAIVLSKRFSLAFLHLQNANQELELANEELQTKSEEIFHKNEQLTQLNTELDSLVYRVSHDLRSPVASVMGLIDISRGEEDVNEVMHYMQLQEKTLRRMDALIQDIIDYSRNKRTELTHEAVDFRKLATDIIADHSHLENAERIDIQPEVDQPVAFVSDVKRLTIVLSNLLSNAIRYHDLHKEKPFIRLHVAVTPLEAVIEIRDNGQGIGAEHLDRIFEMFYRANEHAKGSGLGLYLVQEAVTKLKGTIQVRSERGQSTTFRVVVPNLA
jgi:signal transduction histidine kinase